MNHIDKNLRLISVLRNADGDALDPHFSWSPCDCCGDSKGGDRFDAKALVVEGEKSKVLKHLFAVCPDCVVDWQ